MSVVELDRPFELFGWCRRMANATTIKISATTGVANDERRAAVLRLRGRGAGVLRHVGRRAGTCRLGAGFLIQVSGLLTAAAMLPACSTLRTAGRLRSHATTLSALSTRGPTGCSTTSKDAAPTTTMTDWT